MTDFRSSSPSGSDLPPTVPSGSGGSDLVGTVLAGRYRILKKLGGGGMGAVYLGEHLKFGRKDAIKILHPSLATDPEAIARFNRGARNVSAIRHPNICTIYDCSDTAEGLQFLAMEFVPGETLKDILDREHILPVERAVGIAKQVADALEAAHDAGIIHRDLKPANIMVLPGRSGSDEVRVVDFDIAKGTLEEDDSEVTRIGYTVGTPEYMSPEQLTADRLDGRSDLYSLGLILFRMLTGTFPFRFNSKEELPLARLTQRPLRLGEVVPDTQFPPELEAVLDRALQPVLADRYPNADALGRDLTHLLGSQRPPAAPETALPRAPVTEQSGGRSGSIPATQVSEPPAGVGSASTSTPPRFSFRRTGMTAVAGILFVLILGAVAWAVTQRGSGAEEPIQTVSVPEPAVTTPTSRPPPEVTEIQPVPPTAVSPSARPEQTALVTATQDEPPSRPERQPARTPSRSDVREPPRAVTVPNAPSPASENASEILRGLTRRLQDPEPAELPEMRRTAERIWGQDVGPDDKARAAFVMAQIRLLQGDRAQCAFWAGEAVNHNRSHPGYQRLQRECEAPAP